MDFCRRLMFLNLFFGLMALSYQLPYHYFHNQLQDYAQVMAKGLSYKVIFVIVSLLECCHD